jgi:hypothetical protein
LESLLIPLAVVTSCHNADSHTKRPGKQLAPFFLHQYNNGYEGEEIQEHTVS